MLHIQPSLLLRACKYVVFDYIGYGVTVVPPLIPHRWLHTLNEYGVCLLTDYGTTKGSVKEVRQVLFLVVVNIEFLFSSLLCGLCMLFSQHFMER